MNLDNSPQTLRYGEKVFTTGGIFTTPSENCKERCGIILELGEDSGPQPTAMCGFGIQNILDLPLEDLMPVTLETPIEAGKKYVLHRCVDDMEGQRASVLGIAESRNVLLQLVLEDAKEYPHAKLMSTYMDGEDGPLCFRYENDEQSEELYLSYSVEAVPFYSAKGGATV